jgi:hypothetical protein
MSECKHSCSDGERIQISIDVFGGMIGWERIHPAYLSILSILIPETIHQRQLYPYMSFSNSFYGAVTVLRYQLVLSKVYIRIVVFEEFVVIVIKEYGQGYAS